MEDIFFFQKTYLLTNKYNILDYKRILELNNKYENIEKLKKKFTKKIIENIKNENYSIDLNNFILKYKIYYSKNIYEFINNIKINYIEESDIDLYFIKDIYNIDLEDNLILKNIYEDKILIKNENEFNDLFTNIKLKKYKYSEVYKYFYKNINDKILKNIQELELKFKNLKNNKIFLFYRIVLNHLNLEKDDLIYYLIINNFEFNLDNFVKLYKDVYIKHKFNNLNNFYLFYFNNFNKFNSIVSEKLFEKLFKDFDLNFFKNVYDNLLRFNKINYDNNLEIYNFYYKNIDLFINYNIFKKKYNDIDKSFIKNVYLNKNNNFYIYINFILNNTNFLYNFKDFIKSFNNFDLSIYLKNSENLIKNNYDIVKELVLKKTKINYKYDEKNNLNIDFIKNYYNYNNLNERDLYLLSYNSNFIYNFEVFEKKYDINIYFIKLFNNLLKNDKYSLIIEKIKKEKEKYNLDYLNFKNKYINLISNFIDFNNSEYLEYLNRINNNQELINFFSDDIYKLNINKNYIGRKNVFIIEEVLIDLKRSKPNLKDGISLIIRAKNEEKNIKICIESVVDLVDEIIFINNNSDDNTLKIIEELSQKYKKVKVYNYYINVNKVGIEHQKAIENNDSNTLGNFYNWCLSKSTMKNIIKWDADFICVRNNFKSMIDNLKVKEKDNKYAIWFTGYTLFINKEENFINLKSYYNEFRLFSYENNFKWYDGDLCEYNDPYIEKCDEKIYINEPIFYEIKRTDLDEFNSRSSLIDERDKNDFNILNNLLKNKKNKNLFKLEEKLINKDIKIILFVNNFDLGGSNFFIIELYNYFKLLGFTVNIYSQTIKKNVNNFNKINLNDIYDFSNLHNFYLKLNTFDYIFFNGFISDNVLNNIFNKTIKKIFITHSDVAFSNYFIEKYHDNLYKIITVNELTKNKLISKLNINKNKIEKIINYTNIENDKEINLNRVKKFGIITRLSDDKNIIMLLYALKNFFKIYNDYKFYLVGYENENIEEYIKIIIKHLDLEEYVKIEGYQYNIKKYYEMFDFIILPSVSEGASYNLIESMIYKKLIITSDVGGNRELLKDNSIYIEYENIKEYERDVLYINNYDKQLEILGYYNITDYNEFYLNYKLLIDYDIKNIKNIPSVLLQNKNMDEENINNLFNLNKNWNKNVIKIFDCLIKAIKIDDENKIIMINRNYNFIKEEYNKNEYYKNINKILDI